MPLYHYKALNANGSQVEADLEAADRKSLMLLLRESSLTPLEVTESAVTPSAFIPSRRFPWRSGRVTRKTITRFTIQLSALVKSGMNLAKALAALERQCDDGDGMKPLLRGVIDEVQRGRNLSEALERYPAYFSPLYVNMIRIGETGGVLDKSLQRLVEMRSRDEELIGRIKGALTYPAVMGAVMLASVAVMLTFVVPRFNGVFAQMGTGLPLPTRIVIASGSFLAVWWWLVLLLLGGSVTAAMYLLRRDEFRIGFDRYKLQLPLLGRIIHDICLARYSLSLSALLGGGVPMMKALEATIPVTGNRYVEDRLRQVVREVREGGSLSHSLRQRGEVFPNLMAGMVGTGEETGNLDEMLENIGEYYRRESEEKIGTLTTMFEPAMIVIMGGIVGFIVAAIILPIFNVSSSIH